MNACLVAQLCPTLCDSLDCSLPDSCPWDFPGYNTWVGCHYLLEEIFPIQGSNPCLPCLLYYRWIVYPLSHWGSPSNWKRLWCWEGLEAGGKGDDRGWDGWMASLTRWTWVWVKSRSWWWTGRPGVLWFMGSQRVGHDWATELNWTEPENHDIKNKQ